MLKFNKSFVFVFFIFLFNSSVAFSDNLESSFLAQIYSKNLDVYYNKLSGSHFIYDTLVFDSTSNGNLKDNLDQLIYVLKNKTLTLKGIRYDLSATNVQVILPSSASVDKIKKYLDAANNYYVKSISDQKSVLMILPKNIEYDFSNFTLVSKRRPTIRLRGDVYETRRSEYESYNLRAFNYRCQVLFSGL